ncbi:MAG: NmrA family NAD(P)-binding protein [Candidatus Limnocylindrales bacterium]
MLARSRLPAPASRRLRGPYHPPTRCRPGPGSGARARPTKETRTTATTGKVLVTGATGNTGPGLVSALFAAGVDVRVLVRDEAKARPLQAN